MFEEGQVAGTPMFIVKAYLPVNESFGKFILTIFLSLNQLHDSEFQNRASETYVICNW